MTEWNDEGRDDVRGRRTVRILAVILILLLLLLCSVGYFFIRILVPAGSPEEPVVSDGMTWVRSIYGFGPSVDEQLLGPTAVAVAPNGRIYVTDPQRARVLAFNPDGVFAGIIQTGAAGTGVGQLGRPEDLACDSDGNLYVTDRANDKIIVFDDNYEYVREWPAPQVVGIDVANETLYARRLGEVVAFTLEGQERARFGERGRGKGAAIEPAGGVTADAERVYVPDALNQSLKAFSLEGAFLWAQPSEDGTTGVNPGVAEGVAATGTAQARVVDLPQDVVLDANGQLYFVDAFSFLIARVDNATGEILGQWGRDGQDDGQFMYPTSIAYDSDRDWFVVADTANNRVQIVRIDGSGGRLAQAASRSLSSPYRVCAIPLFALVAILILIALTRRRRQADTYVNNADVEVAESRIE